MDNPWIVTIVGGLVVAIVGYFVLGIGKNQSKTNNVVKKSPVNVNGNGIIVNSTVITDVKDQHFRNPEQVESSPKTTKPTAVEILLDIKGRPLFQQEQIGTIYEGNKVLWQLKLAHIHQDDEIFHVIAVENQKTQQEVAAVSFEVKAKQYPELKSMMKHTELFVKGEIQKVSPPGSIFLKNTAILFPKTLR